MTISSDSHENDRVPVSDQTSPCATLLQLEQSELTRPFAAAGSQDHEGGIMVDVVTDLSSEQDRDRGQSYVIFRLGGEGYALEVMRVQEVLDMQALTEVPGGPKVLLGVINLRGHVVPVYDLRMTFGLSKDLNQNRAPCVLIVESGTGSEVQITGLLVDRVSDVLEFSPEEVQAAPQLGLGKATPFVRGLIRHQDAFLLVLDVDRVFSTLGSLNGEGA
jgi:purine-binding chemotaxis protein CheW